jgi:hypothetical protein
MFLFLAALSSTSRLCDRLLNLSHPINQKRFLIKELFLKCKNEGYDYFLAAFGRLAPYLERRCKRPLTPAVSKVPRTM